MAYVRTELLSAAERYYAWEDKWDSYQEELYFFPREVVSVRFSSAKCFKRIYRRWYSKVPTKGEQLKLNINRTIWERLTLRNKFIDTHKEKYTPSNALAVYISFGGEEKKYYYGEIDHEEVVKLFSFLKD